MKHIKRKNFLSILLKILKQSLQFPKMIKNTYVLIIEADFTRNQTGFHKVTRRSGHVGYRSSAKREIALGRLSSL